jgi:predicted amidohydrolase YtcJ
MIDATMDPERRAAASTARRAAVSTERRPVVFSGGPIRTMDAIGRAEVAVVHRGRVAAVGETALLERWPDADHVDLAGHTLVPGFIDAHNHLSIAALAPCWGDAARIDGPDALVAAVRAQAAADPEAEWVRLHGWDETKTGYVPSRADLDAAGVERPVVVGHSTLHQCVVSSAALVDLAIGRTTPDPAGGEIGRGPDGEPSGLLVERAWSEAHARSLAAYADRDRWGEHVAARARVLLRDGITAVHDAACAPEAEALYRSMARDRALPISVLALPHPSAILRNDLGARLDGPVTGEGDEWMRVGPVKLFADGGVAIALDASIEGHAIRFGLLMDDLEAGAIAAASRGYRIAVHAIGNVGVAAAIGAFSEVLRRVGDGDHRFRLEHAGVTSPAQWRRLAELGAVAVVQPGFVEHVGIQSQGVRFDDHHWLAFAGLAEAGVTLAGSSDDPCAPVAPLWGATLGASRTTSTGIRFEPDQAVGFDEWLAAYTVGAARAGGQEDERGRIAPGLRADLVVLDLGSTRPEVVETWVDGRRAHARDDPADPAVRWSP